jgi:hypothetical protein
VLGDCIFCIFQHLVYQPVQFGDLGLDSGDRRLPGRCRASILDPELGKFSPQFIKLGPQ